MAAIALTIAGSDSGGGAGIQADLKAFSAMGAYGASAITAITAQNTVGVQAVEAISPQMVKAQLQSVFDDLPVAAVKIGMLGGADIIGTVAEILAGRNLPIVLDPVMIAKSGDRLLAKDAVGALVDELLPLATLITPNLPEAAYLLGQDVAEEEAAREEQGKALVAMGAKWVLMKGGHASGDICTDILIGPEMHKWSSQRQYTPNTHGTGCTLSSAICAGLAQGKNMPDAITSAHDYLQQAIVAGAAMHIGSGQGPVHHFHQWWRP